MATSTAAAPGRSSSMSGKKKVSFWESQRLAKVKQYEKQAKRKKIKLDQLTIFTQQLSSMLEAGLPLVSALEALQDQTEDPVFQIIIRNVRHDVSGGTAFSEAVTKYPNAFPNLFTSMVEAGEASGGLASILGKVAIYFEDTVKLTKKVKSAMTYPIAVIALAVALVQVLLIFVIPVFADMFSSFGKELPKPTLLLIATSNFLKSYIIYLIIGFIGLWYLIKRIVKTPRGRRAKDVFFMKVPILGDLLQKIALSRFCRTYAILLRSGVPILRTLEIVSNASGNTYIERSCKDISRNISQGGQLSETIADIPYFPPTVKHMARAGEQTGNVDGMMGKIADFYDAEIETTVDSLTSLMEPALIVFLGIVIGSIVMAMFLPIFNLAGAIS
ncbi:type II secretion system F family protein [Puniceicoccales bacterium CK1056]|uniref:General secretion pathway protein F n=1 Tax=Oceanipulchritudo coccoides TaxID=2706888 RepID=A0A6B2M1N2_9BACT|nr:type II secretion system F family protein [Oceanipulchritudo coccoides]NDV62119.1 type II secretion system F family protein [Oceanipulchritudo coccoides]